MNKTLGPGNRLLFDYSAEAPLTRDAGEPADLDPLSNPARGEERKITDLGTLEGTNDDPTYTKVVDRRWYERNKHIYPASVWQDFDPEKDYQNEVRRDTGGNTFFFAK
jgi:protein FAM50